MNRNTSRNSVVPEYCISHEPEAGIRGVEIVLRTRCNVVKFTCECNVEYEIKMARGLVIDLHIADPDTTYMKSRRDFIKFNCLCGKTFQLFGPDVNLMRIEYKNIDDNSHGFLTDRKAHLGPADMDIQRGAISRHKCQIC